MYRTETVFDGDEVIRVITHDVSWKTVRRERDRALADTDWRAVKDRTMSQAWKDYRTALRDLPQDHEEANDAADHWPVMPIEA